MPKNVMTYPQVIRAAAILDQHCHKIEGTKLCIFDEGWDDARIATEVGVTPTNISNLRLQTLGKLQLKLEGNLLQRLLEQHNALCESLGAANFKVTS